jgi:hypothetical protein
VKRLQQVRRVQQLTHGDDLVFIAVLVKYNQVMTLTAIQNKQLMAANSALPYVLVKVL